MKFDVKMAVINVGGSVLIVVGFTLTAIGIFFFFTEGRDLLNYMLYEGRGVMNISTELRHLLIGCVIIAVGLLTGFIGIFILKESSSLP